MSVNLKALIGKLNDVTRNALESAAGFCLARTHYDVEVEHYLMKLLDSTSGDLAAILNYFDVDKSLLAAELIRSLDRLKSGNARTPALSPSLRDMLTVAWTLGSIDYGATQIRSGFTILALAANRELSLMMRDWSQEFQKISGETLSKNFSQITARSAEAGETTATSASGPRPTQRATSGAGTPNLDQYTDNLTERARLGKLDPVLARDFEIRQVVDILTRRRQNNPILVGEAGVGKTAVVEGFALRVAQGEVPLVLKNVQVRTLDLALLQAGAGVKGEFENRLKNLIEEVKNSPTPIILFIDEAHTMIGAGGQAGQNDAANLLKPALARGELRTIAATTWSEYKKYFEKDAALTRRFQLVKVEEPTEAQCQLMLRGVVPALEKHHGVRILDEALMAAVKLAHRYLADRQLPDKAVSVLDTACARLSLGQNATPGPIEDAKRVLEDLEMQTRTLQRESAVGCDHSERINSIAEQHSATQSRLNQLSVRWERERALVARIRDARARLEIGAAATAVATNRPAPGSVEIDEINAKESIETCRIELERLNAELVLIQGETPLMRVCVDAQLVGTVISDWTGIPVGKMLKDEITTVLKLESLLGARVIGQSHALESISRRIRTARANLDDPCKPVGVFLLTGPSGVGKTETALALSDLLYGGEHNLITINMSEFQEAHTVSALKGSPPGYVGYGEGGVLTEAVRRRPYSVVLLDEVEKAHPDVLDLFFQVFDKGVLEDGEGRVIDFKNTIIILTSNAGTETLMKVCSDPETMPEASALGEMLKPELNKIFKPAFLGRLVLIPYFPVRDENLKRIVVLKLGKILRRLKEIYRIDLIYEPELLAEIVRRCTESESGARNVDNILTNTLLPEISHRLLAQIAEGSTPTGITVGITESGSFQYLS
jgi:type VI secretion system protein VasG